MSFRRLNVKKNPYAFYGWKHTGYKKKKRCERCPNRSGLVVHHKDRDKSNNYDHSNLETLCRACHAKEHAAEIAESQRRPDVNKRRGVAVSKARTGKHYPKSSEATRRVWQGPTGVKQRRRLRSKAFRAASSKRMRENNPGYLRWQHERA
jgi:hypothetical protein